MTVDRAVTHVAFCVLFAGSPSSVFGQVHVTDHAGPPDPVYLMVRSDDAGFSHSVNMALQRLSDPSPR